MNTEAPVTDPREHLKRWMRDKPLDAQPTCVHCGGPHPYDTSIPSPLWNSVIRAQGLPDYLCLTCITRAFAHAGVSFTAELYGDGFGGLPIEIRVNGADATSARDLSDENNLLRSTLRDIQEQAQSVLAKVTSP